MRATSNNIQNRVPYVGARRCGGGEASGTSVDELGDGQVPRPDRAGEGCKAVPDIEADRFAPPGVARIHDLAREAVQPQENLVARSGRTCPGHAQSQA